MNSLQLWHSVSDSSNLIAANKSNPTSLLLPLLLVVAFYFLLIRPQRNRQKQATALRSTLLPGQRIVTIGGLFGTVTEVDDEGFGLLIAPGVEVRFSKAALGKVIASTGEHEALPDTHDEPETPTD